MLGARDCIKTLTLCLALVFTLFSSSSLPCTMRPSALSHKYHRLEIAPVGLLPPTATPNMRLLRRKLKTIALHMRSLLLLMRFRLCNKSSSRWPPQIIRLRGCWCIAFAAAKWGIDFWFDLPTNLAFFLVECAYACVIVHLEISILGCRVLFHRFCWPCCPTGAHFGQWRICMHFPVNRLQGFLGRLAFRPSGVSRFA